jgi:hypothetical protein
LEQYKLRLHGIREFYVIQPLDEDIKRPAPAPPPESP